VVGPEARFRVELSGSIPRFEVATLEEAEEEVEREVDNWDFDSSLIELEDEPGIDVAFLPGKMKEAHISEAIDRLRRAWEDPEDSEE